MKSKPVLACALMMIAAVTATGCGDEGTKSSTSSTAASGHEAYQACLKEHGVAGPQEGAKGAPPPPSDPKVLNEAVRACADRLPKPAAGGQPAAPTTPPPTQAPPAAAAAYEACLKKGGYDPRKPPAAGQDAEQVQALIKKCSVEAGKAVPPAVPQ